MADDIEKELTDLWRQHGDGVLDEFDRQLSTDAWHSSADKYTNRIPAALRLGADADAARAKRFRGSPEERTARGETGDGSTFDIAAEKALGAGKWVLDKLSGPAQSVQAGLDSANDTFTLGAWPRITDAIGATSPKGRQERADAHPVASDIGKGVGYGAGALLGPGRLAAQAGAGAATALGVAARPILGGAVAGGVDAMMQAGARGAIEGRPVSETAGDVLEQGAGGAVMGAAVPAIVAAAGRPVKAGLKWADDKIRDPRNLSGQYIDALERTAPYRQTEEYKGLKHGMQGIAQQASKQGEVLGDVQEQLLSEANAEWRAAHDALPGRDEAHDVGGVVNAAKRQIGSYSNKTRGQIDRSMQPIVDQLEENLSRDVTRYEPAPAATPARGPGRPTGPIERQKLPGIGDTGPDTVDQANALGNAKDEFLDTFTGARPTPRLSKETALVRSRDYALPEGGPRASGSDATVDLLPVTERKPVATLDDLIKKKQELKDLAEYGQGATKENLPYRKMYDALVDEIAKVSPEMASIDKRYMTKMKALEEVNGIAFGNEDARAATGSLRAQAKGGQFLSMSMADTKASGLRLEQLQKIRDVNPELYGPIIDKVLAKVADEGTKFGGANVFGHTGKWGGALIGQNLDWLRVRQLDPYIRRTLTDLPADAVTTAAKVAGRDLLTKARLDEKDVEEARAERLRRQQP